jgi:hypothetical protein
MIRRQLEERTMNLKTLIALFAAAAFAAGTVACDEKKADDKKEEAKKDDDKKGDKKDDGDTKAAKDDGDSGDLPQECQDYIKETEACLGKIDEPAAKSAIEMSLKAQRDAFAAANSPEAKGALKTSCEAALKGIKDNPACK